LLLEPRELPKDAECWGRDSASFAGAYLTETMRSFKVKQIELYQISISKDRRRESFRGTHNASRAVPGSDRGTVGGERQMGSVGRDFFDRLSVSLRLYLNNPPSPSRLADPQPLRRVSRSPPEYQV
jgi:hypothetical protein